MGTRKATILAGLLVVMGMPVCTPAATVHVPDDQPSIQAGIVAAQFGDTVLIAPGTYDEYDIELKDGVAVMGEARSYPAVTIDAHGLGRIMLADNPSDRPMHAHIEGIVFRNGFASSGGGIYATGTNIGFDLEITACAFEGNRATQGGGVCIEASSAILRKCRFSENKAQYGGGLACSGWNWDQRISVINCEFAANHVAQSGGAVSIMNISLRMSGCRLHDNDAEYSGGALYSSNYNGRQCSVLECTFERNWGTYGGAFYSMEDVLLVSGCLFVENAAVQGGAAWIAYPRDAAIGNCTFARNVAPKGSGICFSELALLSLDRSIFAFGDGSSAIACVWGQQFDLRLSCCDIYGNEGGDWVGCVADQYGVSGNICLDPLLCLGVDPDDPYALQAGSPCAEGNNSECGQIGALPVGCQTTASAVTSFSAIKALY